VLRRIISIKFTKLSLQAYPSKLYQNCS